MTLLRRSQFNDLETIQNRINRLFEETFGVPRGAAREDTFVGTWAPPVNISEDEEQLVVEAELPGLRHEDVQVNLEQNVLTIRGERKFEDEQKKDSYHRIERSYGAFARSFTLNKPVQLDKINARFKDGILTVVLPKAEESRPRTIDIKVD
jgi:HSP20 family protein